MENREKKIITKKMITENHRKANGCGVISALLMLVLFAVVIGHILKNGDGMGWVAVLFGLPVVFWFVCFVYFGTKYLSGESALNDDKYIIKIAKCVRKIESVDYSDDSPGKSYVYSVNLACESHFNENFSVSYEEYTKCRIGDLYYAVIAATDNKMILQFRCDDYELSEELESKLVVEDENPDLEIYIEAMRYAASADECDKDMQSVELLKKAIEKFETISDYKDVRFRIEECKEKIYKIARKCSGYDRTRRFAADTFAYLGDYKYSKSKKKALKD